MNNVSAKFAFKKAWQFCCRIGDSSLKFYRYGDVHNASNAGGVVFCNHILKVKFNDFHSSKVKLNIDRTTIISLSFDHLCT